MGPRSRLRPAVVGLPLTGGPLNVDGWLGHDVVVRPVQPVVHPPVQRDSPPRGVDLVRLHMVASVQPQLARDAGLAEGRPPAHAKATAGDKDVQVRGASMAQAALEAGVLDEIQIHQVPVLLGSGHRLFEILPAEIELEIVQVIDTPAATHLRYRVLR